MWEKGRVQSAKRMSAKQLSEAIYMECPFIVRYNDGCWLHEFYDTKSHLKLYIFDCMVEGIGNNG